MPDLDFVPLPRTASAATGPAAATSRAAVPGRAAVPAAAVPAAVVVGPAPAVRPALLADLSAAAAPVGTVDLARSAGYAAGYAAGFAAGARRAAVHAEAQADAVRDRAAGAEAERAARHAAAVAALDAAAAAAQRRLDPVLDDCLDAVHAAAVELAVALLGVELSDAGRSAAAAVARALAVRPDVDPVAVRLHPSDVDVLTTPDRTPLPASVRVVADAALQPGDAVAEHADGHVDARLETAVARARAALGLA